MRRIKYITHHNLNIVSESIRSQQTQHSNNRKLHMCLDHVGKLTRSRKWSTKRGGEHHISTGHGPMDKVDYSRHIREASMEMEGLPEVVPPSGRVPGQRLLAVPILKRRRRWYREEIGKRTSILWISSAGAKYRPKEGVRGHQGARRPLGAA